MGGKGLQHYNDTTNHKGINVIKSESASGDMIGKEEPEGEYE